jgi:hypothetical protein
MRRVYCRSTSGQLAVSSSTWGFRSVCNSFNDDKKRKHFLVKCSRISKRTLDYFLERSQSLHFRSSDNSSKYMDFSTKYWRNYNDREKSKYPKESLSRCHLFNHKTQMYWPGSNPHLRVGGRDWDKEREKKLKNKGVEKVACYGAGGWKREHHSLRGSPGLAPSSLLVGVVRK